MENNTEQVFLLNPSPHDQHTTPLQRAFAMPVAAMEPEDIQQTTVLCQLPQDSMHPPSRTNMCRLCATITELVVPIFEGDGLQNSLADKIHQHLPIQVSPNDILPIVMCFQCTSTLMAWHELVVCSAQADTALRERFTVGFSTTQEQQHQQSNIEASETQSKDIESQEVSNIVTNVLKEYLNLLNMEDGLQTELACQSCSAQPSRTAADFTVHLVSEHRGQVRSERDARAFVRDHVTFAETLGSDREADADSDGGADRAPPRPALLCPRCACAFSSATRLAHHLRAHSRTAPARCCGQPYPARRDLLAHLRRAHAGPAARAACRACGHAAASPAALRAHVAAVHADRPRAACRACGHAAASPAALRAHVAAVHADRPRAACRACGHAAASPAALRAHVAAVHADRPRAAPAPAPARNQKFIPVACPDCGRTFSNKYNMVVHRRRHAGARPAAPHACPDCGRRYSTRGNLAQHARLAHAGRLPYACAHCGEGFAARGLRDVHARLHSGARPFPCDRCPAAFRSRDSLAAHAAAHRDLRPHACARCGKRFRKSSHLAAHARTHRPQGGAAGQAGRSCAQCGRRFADAGNLARHARAVHAARRPHACATCGARFSRRDHLQEHARAHADARDFLCEVCGAATKSRAALRMHRVSHGAARHACPECGARFKRRAELRAHLSVHSGERAHACPACPRTFRLRAQLNAHARTRALICSTRATAAPPATSNLCPSEPIPQTRLK